MGDDAASSAAAGISTDEARELFFLLDIMGDGALQTAEPLVALDADGVHRSTLDADGVALDADGVGGDAPSSVGARKAAEEAARRAEAARQAEEAEAARLWLATSGGFSWSRRDSVAPEGSGGGGQAQDSRRGRGKAQGSGGGGQAQGSRRGRLCPSSSA